MPAATWIRPQNLPDIRSEILAGLPNERDRLDDAMFNLEFYEGNFSRFPPRWPNQSRDSKRYPRTIPLVQRIINVLTDYLYATGPTRTIAGHPEATEWLNAVYKANDVNSLWQSAEQLSGVTRVAAFEVCAGTDPMKPVEITVWDGSQLSVWCHPDCPCQPIAFGVIDLYDMQRRIRLWTPGEMETFATDKWNPGQPNAEPATAYRSVASVPNPYGLIPFSTVHWRKPIRDFYTSAPGSMLREANDGTNFFLTYHADGVRYNTNPVIVLKNVRPGWTPSRPVKPGDIWDLPGDDEAEESGKQEAAYLQADVGFVAAGWEDLNQYLDLVLEMNGVPPAAIRLVQDAATSGIQIVVEQTPLILWAKKRQRPFSHYEHNLACLTLRIGASHLGSQKYAEYQVTAGKLLAAAEQLELTLKWPDMWPDIPGDDRDKQDLFALENGLTSRTKLLMRRSSLTREEAEADLEETAADLKRERKLLGEMSPADELAAQAAAAAAAKGQGEDLENENEDPPDDTEET